MRISLQPAFILHQRPYRETSVLLEVFSKDYGRLSVVAKGVRQPRSRLKSLLQPFSPLLLSWQGKSELMTLSAAEPNGTPFYLRKDCLVSGFYLNELLIRLLYKYDPHPKIYTVYQQTLIELASGELKESTLRLFEKKLLEEIGYGLGLEYSSKDQPIVDNKSYQYHPEHGFIAMNETSHEHFIFSGKSILALANEKLDNAECLKEIKRLMRIVLTPLLGEKPLQSRKLFFEVES